MTPFQSLSRKIAALGLLNLALVALAVFTFARIHYGLGPESLLVGPARDRILAIGDAFRLELNGHPDPAALVEHFGEAYDAKSFLVHPHGGAIIGPEVTLPPGLMERMRQGGAGPGPPKKKGPDGPEFPPPPKQRPREPFFFTVTRNPTYYWTAIRFPFERGGEERPAILLLRSESLFNTKLFFDWRPWIALGVALTAISAACWLPFLRGLTGAIGQMDRVTEQIAQGRFSARLAEQRTDELGHLGAQINRMAARLEAFVRSQKRFMGDTAHELSAPIARIQFALGILEQRAQGQSQRDIDVLREEVQEMSGLVAEMLSFSKAGLDPAGAALETLKPAEIARRAASRECVEAKIDIAEDLEVMGLERQLLRAIGNLLRNAARYAGGAGPITVAATRSGDRVTIHVRDEGPGLPDEAIEHIFEPFYRPQDSRSRDSGGVGLGLAIVKTCIEACQGTVSCRNRSPRGFEVTMVLGAGRGALS